MSRTKGTLGLSSNIEPSMNAPLDGRETTGLLSDLTASEAFPYFYEGMTVYVKEVKKSYQLIGSDPTLSASWKEVGSGSEIVIDSTPTSGSNNAVSSGGVYSALSDKADLVNGTIPAAQLPSYVDDVKDGYLYNGAFYSDSEHTQLITAESDKIYQDVSTNKTYRWTGSAYVATNEGVVLGETSSTAYRGDRGKTAYDHSQTTSGNPHGVTKSDVGLGSVVNTGDSATPTSGGTTKFTTGGAYTLKQETYNTGDSAFTAIADADYIPVYDTSASTKKKSLWSNIKSVLKTYFDSLYNPILTAGDNISISSNTISASIAAPSGKVDSSDFLSTSEKIVGGSANGYPIYQKTISIGALPNATTKTTNHSISDIQSVIKIWGIYFDASTMAAASTFGVIPQSDATNKITVVATKTQIKVTSATNLSSFYGYVTIQYTKTTDSASMAYDITRPDTWPNGTEINFGDGLYGMRRKGNFTATAANNTFSLDFVSFGTTLSGKSYVMNCGGTLTITDDNNDIIGRTITTASAIAPTTGLSAFDAVIQPIETGIAFKVRLYTLKLTTSNKYDIWALYKKQAL